MYWHGGLNVLPLKVRPPLFGHEKPLRMLFTHCADGQARMWAVNQSEDENSEDDRGAAVRGRDGREGPGKADHADVGHLRDERRADGRVGGDQGGHTVLVEVHQVQAGVVRHRVRVELRH